MEIPQRYLLAAAQAGLVRIRWTVLSQRSGLSVQHCKNVLGGHPHVSPEARARVERALGLGAAKAPARARKGKA